MPMRLSSSILTVAAAAVCAAYLFPAMFTAMERKQPAIPAPSPRAVATAPAAAPVLSGMAKIAGDPDGHFRVTARIGSRRVPFLVDTGATTVALSWETGLDLGLVRSADRMDVTVSTANGSVKGKHVSIDRIEIGDVSVGPVTAIVLPPGALQGNLLGMSFLGRLRHFEIARDTLILQR